MNYYLYLCRPNSVHLFVLVGKMKDEEQDI